MCHRLETGAQGRKLLSNLLTTWLWSSLGLAIANEREIPVFLRKIPCFARVPEVGGEASRMIVELPQYFR